MSANLSLERTVPAWSIQNGQRITTTCILKFNPNEPIVVTFLFGPDRIRWEAARDLVIGALKSWHQPVGLGDFRAWAADHRTRPMLRLEVRSPDGRGVLDLPHKAVHRFISDTRDSLPQGAESAWFAEVADDVVLAAVVGRWRRKLLPSDRCPACRDQGCRLAEHLRLRAEIDADERLRRRIEATDD